MEQFQHSKAEGNEDVTTPEAAKPFNEAIA